MTDRDAAPAPLREQVLRAIADALIRNESGYQSVDDYLRAQYPGLSREESQYTVDARIAADAALAVVRANLPEPANGDGLNEYRDSLWEWLS